MLLLVLALVIFLSFRSCTFSADSLSFRFTCLQRPPLSSKLKKMAWFVSKQFFMFFCCKFLLFMLNNLAWHLIRWKWRHQKSFKNITERLQRDGNAANFYFPGCFQIFRLCEHIDNPKPGPLLVLNLLPLTV